jgi:hypothetical protein
VWVNVSWWLQLVKCPIWKVLYPRSSHSSALLRLNLLAVGPACCLWE